MFSHEFPHSDVSYFVLLDELPHDVGVLNCFFAIADGFSYVAVAVVVDVVIAVKSSYQAAACVLFLVVVSHELSHGRCVAV